MMLKGEAVVARIQAEIAARPRWRQLSPWLKSIETRIKANGGDITAAMDAYDAANAKRQGAGRVLR